MTLNSIWRTPGNIRSSRSSWRWRPLPEPGIILRVFSLVHRPARPPDVPENLRRDVGLPVEHKMPDWWELR